MLQGSRRNQAEKSRFVQKRLIDAAQGQSVSPQCFVCEAILTDK